MEQVCYIFNDLAKVLLNNDFECISETFDDKNKQEIWYDKKLKQKIIIKFIQEV